MISRHCCVGCLALFSDSTKLSITTQSKLICKILPGAVWTLLAKQSRSRSLFACLVSLAVLGWTLSCSWSKDALYSSCWQLLSYHSRFMLTASEETPFSGCHSNFPSRKFTGGGAQSMQHPRIEATWILPSLALCVFAQPLSLCQSG